MNAETAAAVYDRLVPGWRDARRNGQNRRVPAPYRTDEHPSVDIHEQKLTWYDRALSQGGGAYDLALLTLGDEGARELMRDLGDGVAVSVPAQAKGMSQNVLN